MLFESLLIAGCLGSQSTDTCKTTGDAYLKQEKYDITLDKFGRKMTKAYPNLSFIAGAGVGIIKKEYRVNIYNINNNHFNIESKDDVAKFVYIFEF